VRLSLIASKGRMRGAPHVKAVWHYEKGWARWHHCALLRHKFALGPCAAMRGIFYHLPAHRRVGVAMNRRCAHMEGAGLIGMLWFCVYMVDVTRKSGAYRCSSSWCSAMAVGQCCRWHSGLCADETALLWMQGRVFVWGVHLKMSHNYKAPATGLVLQSSPRSECTR